MSRIGKKPIPLPSGVKITVGEELEVTGPKGKLKVPIPDGITFEQADGKLEVKRSGDEHAAIHGLTRALAANAVQGVSHEMLLPEGVDLKIDKQTHLVLSGHDRQLLGQVAANMRALRKPDPYKNKGVRYTGEALRKKVGKTGASAK